MICVNIYTFNEFKEKHGVGFNEAARMVGIDPRNRGQREKTCDVIEVVGGPAVLIPKKVAKVIKEGG